MQPSTIDGMMSSQPRKHMIEAIQTLAAAPIDWSIAAGPIWLVVGLLTVAVPLLAFAVEDFFRGH
jgi:hypothetical protein